MKKFLTKFLLFCIPLAIPVVLFIIIDPFMILPQNAGKIKLKENYNITPNRDFQSIELFLKNYDEYQYNSFIMGNSRSFFYNVEKWQKYVNGKGFQLNSSNETLYGLEKKLLFLDRNNVAIDNVLIILDNGTLREVRNSDGHLFIKHPLLSNESYISFYLEMLKGFFPKAMIPHVDIFLTERRKEYMKRYGIRENVWELDKSTNQLTYFLYDSILKNNSEKYYSEKEDIFYTRDSKTAYSDAAIGDKQKQLLTTIKSIFKSHETNFKIVINPLYNQIRFNKSDLDYLITLFGEKNIFDFSGKNKITSSYKNYYETSHYRPHIANKIMEEIYDE